MVSGSLALLYFFLGIHGGRQGSGPDRPGWLGLRSGWMAQRGERTDVRTNGWTDGRKISPFYRTSSPIGAAALPPPMKTKEKAEQGKGTADHLMPLGYLLFLSLLRQRP